jgi:hypothetical protein
MCIVIVAVIIPMWCDRDGMIVRMRVGLPWLPDVSCCCFLFHGGLYAYESET